MLQRVMRDSLELRVYEVAVRGCLDDKSQTQEYLWHMSSKKEEMGHIDIATLMEERNEDQRGGEEACRPIDQYNYDLLESHGLFDEPQEALSISNNPTVYPRNGASPIVPDGQNLTGLHTLSKIEGFDAEVGSRSLPSSRGSASPQSSQGQSPRMESPRKIQTKTVNKPTTKESNYEAEQQQQIGEVDKGREDAQGFTDDSVNPKIILDLALKQALSIHYPKEVGGSKRKRTNYSSMSAEEEKIAREMSKKRRATLKCKNEKIRRATLNALMDEIRKELRLPPDGIDQANILSNALAFIRIQTHAGAKTDMLAKSNTPAAKRK